MTPAEEARLAEAIEHITDRAAACGLDFFPMRYEICPPEIIYTFGAYGTPIRFSHWSFGKSFQRQKTSYDYGLSRIYELVINSDPCYAFLLESNTLLQNKLITAHVLAHSDFFKNNFRFARTDRRMVWTMAAFAERVRHYEQEHGRAKVERFLDAALAICEHIDPHFLLKERRAPKEEREPQRDVLLFLMTHAPDLEDWQRDILSSLRAESLYFRPQMETKIMNEGWASYWHSRILRDMDLTPEEATDFARMHAAVLAPSPHHLNPYHLGYHLFESIEKKWGREKMFEVRETETDVSFLRNYLTKQLIEDLDLYVFKKFAQEYRVTHVRDEWEQVRDAIVRLYDNCGFPYIYAVEEDFAKRGELLLRHGHEGVDLDEQYTQQTLRHVFHIWGRPVHLETALDGEAVRYTCSDAGVERRTVDDAA